MGFAREWAARWPDCPPIGHELKRRIPERWVRFHSLPDAKRYATDAAEHAEVLHRHRTVLATLTGVAPLTLLTTSWSETATPVDRDAAITAVRPAAIYAMSVPPQAEDDAWVHIWVEKLVWQADALDDVFRLVADDTVGGIIVAAPDLSWLYHPYDGGADVITATAADRARLAETFRDWRSPRLDGL